MVNLLSRPMRRRLLLLIMAILCPKEYFWQYLMCLILLKFLCFQVRSQLKQIFLCMGWVLYCYFGSTKFFVVNIHFKLQVLQFLIFIFGTAGLRRCQQIILLRAGNCCLKKFIYQVPCMFVIKFCMYPFN